MISTAPLPFLPRRTEKSWQHNVCPCRSFFFLGKKKTEKSHLFELQYLSTYRKMKLVYLLSVVGNMHLSKFTNSRKFANMLLSRYATAGLEVQNNSFPRSMDRKQIKNKVRCSSKRASKSSPQSVCWTSLKSDAKFPYILDPISHEKLPPEELFTKLRTCKEHNNPTSDCLSRDLSQWHHRQGGILGKFIQTKHFCSQDSFW